uniref:Uncharacterized protein n=1 Tax=Ditylenchus dipsaci TaxID=166011 RepID=A0A915DJ03_9BILA
MMVQATSKESDSSSCSRKGKSSRENTTWTPCKKQPTSAEKPLIKKFMQKSSEVMNRVRIRLGINSPLKHASPENR